MSESQEAIRELKEAFKANQPRLVRQLLVVTLLVSGIAIFTVADLELKRIAAKVFSASLIAIAIYFKK